MSYVSLYKDKNGIRFDKVTKEDLGILHELKKESWLTTHSITLSSMESQLSWYESLCKEDIRTPKNIVLIASDLYAPAAVRAWNDSHAVLTKIGVFKMLNIDWYNLKADVAWDVFQVCRGKGYGKRLVEAGVRFSQEVLRMRKLNAEILENNPASMKCALSAGFEQEGVKKEEVYRQGKFLNSHMMGLFTSRLQPRTSS